MAGLLDYITEAAKAQYAKGAPYRNALGGLLSGDMSALQELNKPSPVMPNEALDVAMTFAPMGIVGGDITKILKSLKQQNPSTYPKIPVNKIFKNDVGNLESLDRMKADEGFLNNATTNQFVNINDIIPTQKNVTTKNIKDINNVSALPELIKVNDKYYVNDGHHRISRDILTGNDKIQAKVYEGLLSNNKTPLTEFEVKQLTAQRNAALPVAEGGLGLPATNTAMDRAKALGFDINTPVYHGTNADIKAMNIEGKGKTSGAGAFVTDNPLVSETYISASGEGNILPLLIKKDNLLNVNARGRNWADIWTDQLSAKSGKQKYSLDDLGLDKYSATTTDELGMIANELGKKGVEIKNVRDLGPNSHIFRAKEYLLNKYGIVPDETWSNVTGNQFVEARDFMDKLYKSQKSNITSLQDPSLIRSRFAAFDPFRRNEADILAGVGVGVPVASGLLDIENKKVPNKEKKKTK